jgi:hypothetical protein
MVKPTRENGSSRLSATQVLNKIKPVQQAQRFLERVSKTPPKRDPEASEIEKGAIGAE